MPYAKKYTRNYSSRAKKSYARAKTRTVVRKVVRSLAEKKCLQQSVYTGTAITLTGIVAPIFLNAPIVGAAYNQRVGANIKELSLILRGTLSTTALANAADCVRIIVFRDNANSAGFTPNISDLLDNTLGGYEVAPYNFANRKRYVILHDSCTQVYANLSTSITPYPFMIRMKLSKSLVFQSSAAAGAFSSLLAGGIGMIVIAGNLATTTTVECNAEFWYTDA